MKLVASLAFGLAAAVAPAFAAVQGAGQGGPAVQVCIACHSFDPTAKSPGFGPNLFGVVGRKAGAVPDFAYSRAMKGANITWTEQNLDAFLAAPQKFIPGNRMPFSGLSDAEQRRALITYLETLH
jgi:cytochrome c